MAYYPKERSVNGVFYYGAAGSDQILETNSNFTYTAGTDTVTATNFAGNSTSSTTAENASGLTSNVTIQISDEMAGSATFQDAGDTANVTVTAQSGIIANRDVATSGQSTDEILILSGTQLRRITKGNFVSDLGGGSMSSWQIDGDSGPSQTVDDGDTVAILGGTGLSTVTTAGENLTVNVTGIDSSMIVDGSIANADLANSSVTVTAGNGLTDGGAVSLGGSVTLNVGAGSLIDVQADVIDVDLTEAASATIADQDELIFLDGGTTESKGSTRDLATLMAGNGLTANNSSLDLTSSSITAAADAGSNQTIDLGNTLTIAGGSGITTIASATDTITVNAQLSTTSGTLAGGALTAGVDVFMIDVNGGSESYTLPAVPPEGAMIRVKKIDSSANTITLSAAGGLNIDGGTNYILYNQYESVTLIAGSVAWFVF